MKKCLVFILLLVLFLTGCKPVPIENEDGGVQILNSASPGNIGALSQPTFPEKLNATVKYFDSEIKIDADVTSLQREKFYSYKVNEAFLPKLDGILSVFPMFKDAKINIDDNNVVLPNSSFSDGEMLFSVRDGFGKILIRHQFDSEERIDDEYDEKDDFDFNLTYKQAEETAINTAKAILGENDFEVTSVRRYGKYTKNNYYVFYLSEKYDGVTFSGYGRKVAVGKDEEGYSKYISLRGGNGISVYIDKQGVSEISWESVNLEKYAEVELLDFETLLNKFSTQATLYSMNNFAQFETNSNQTYKKGTIKAYTICKIEMTYAKEFVSPQNPDTSDVIYVPCWIFTAYSERGRERKTIINAINGEILTTSLGM